MLCVHNWERGMAWTSVDVVAE